MVRERYNAIPSRSLASCAPSGLPETMVPPRVAIDSPAIEVMTDLRRVPAVSIGPDVGLDHANNAMILRGVRLLLVVGDDGTVIGTVGATDILGERPLQRTSEKRVNRNELVVRDVMVPADDADVLDLGDVLHAEVGHVVATLAVYAEEPDFFRTDIVTTLEQVAEAVSFGLDDLATRSCLQQAQDEALRA